MNNPVEMQLMVLLNEYLRLMDTAIDTPDSLDPAQQRLQRASENLGLAVATHRAEVRVYLLRRGLLLPPLAALLPSSSGSPPPSLRLDSTPLPPGVLWDEFNNKEGSHS